MKSFSILIVGVFVLICSSAWAQYARFPQTGTIEFEKKINMHAVIKRTINKENEAYYVPMFEQYKKTQPQFKTSKSTLFFSKDKSLYVPVEDKGNAMFSWHPATMQVNTVYTDLSAKTSSIQKKVFEETFLVKDSIRNIKWKITDETREIANYTCRRANAVIMDSIYVVAFFTEQIPVSAGPETFAGLPGMILGLALPHENVTWFATSVTDKPLEKPIVVPAKGKVVNNAGLRATLEKSLKSHKDFMATALKVFML